MSSIAVRWAVTVADHRSPAWLVRLDNMAQIIITIYLFSYHMILMFKTSLNMSLMRKEMLSTCLLDLKNECKTSLFTANLYREATCSPILFVCLFIYLNSVICDLKHIYYMK